jgi:hypothetical protein
MPFSPRSTSIVLAPRPSRLPMATASFSTILRSLPETKWMTKTGSLPAQSLLTMV